MDKCISVRQQWGNQDSAVSEDSEIIGLCFILLISNLELSYFVLID